MAETHKRKPDSDDETAAKRPKTNLEDGAADGKIEVAEGTRVIGLDGPSERKELRTAADLIAGFEEKFSPAAIALFTPERAQLVATPFLFGSNKITVYGHPIIMMDSSKLIAGAMNDFSGVAAEPLHLGSNITLTDDNRMAFVIMWCVINRLYVAPKWDDRPLLITLHMREFSDYFLFDQEKALVQRILTSLIQRKKTSEGKWNLTDIEREHLTKCHRTYFESYLKNPYIREGEPDVAKLVRLSAEALNLKLTPEFETAERYGHGGVLLHILHLGQKE